MPEKYSERQQRLIDDLTGYVIKRFTDCNHTARVPTRILCDVVGDGDGADASKIIRKALENVQSSFPKARLDGFTVFTNKDEQYNPIKENKYRLEPSLDNVGCGSSFWIVAQLAIYTIVMFVPCAFMAYLFKLIFIK